MILLLYLIGYSSSKSASEMGRGTSSGRGEDKGLNITNIANAISINNSQRLIYENALSNEQMHLDGQLSKAIIFCK